MIFRQILLLIPGMILFMSLRGQSTTTQEDAPLRATSISSQYVNAINHKADLINRKLDKKSRKILQQFYAQERRLTKQLGKSDSVKAAAMGQNAVYQYKDLEQRLQNGNLSSPYIGSFDTLTTSLQFFQQDVSTRPGNEKPGQLNQVVSKVKGMAARFQTTEEIKKFLLERKIYLKEQLQHAGFAKELKKLDKQAYYYSVQVNEFKSLLRDHRKAERKVLALLRKSKSFNDFMRKNSMLASLFRLPSDPNDPLAAASLTGLQTRTQVNAVIQQQVGTNGEAQFLQNMKDAQSQLQKLKDKVAKFGNSGSDDVMPDGFEPNDQRAKPFLKRLEYGTNVQTQRASYFFPVTSDIGLSIGYKLHRDGIIGIGASYKIGWGSGWKNIRLSSQGIGFRSFIDWKLKGSFWLSGGFEQNYKTSFNSIEELQDQSAWQQSGLIGLSKVVSLKLKFFKNTKLQLLWDFLSYQQIPRCQPIIFRVGYTF